VPKEDGRVARAIDHDATIRVRNTACCQSQEALAKYGQAEVAFQLQYKPGGVIVHCKEKDVSLRVDDKPANVEDRSPIFFEGMFGTKTVIVEITTAKKTWKQKVQAEAGKTTEVTCAPPP
jgi:hypothetical protein